MIYKKSFKDNESSMKIISKSLHIDRYDFEAKESFDARCIYSAIKMWICVLSAQSSDDNYISKVSIHRKTKQILDTYLKRFCYLGDWFYPQKSSNPVNEIRDILICAGEINEVGFESQIGLAPLEYLNVDTKYSLVLGSIEVSSEGQMSGLAQIIDYQSDEDLDLFDRFGIFPKSSNELLQEVISHARWESLNHINSYEFFDCRLNKVFSSCWVNSIGIDEGKYYMARHQYSYGAYDYGLVKRQNDKYYIYRFHDFYQNEQVRYTQRLMFALKALYGTKVTIRVDRYKGCDLWHFWSKLPPAEDNLLRYIGWPVEKIDNPKNEFIVSKALAGIVYKLAENLNVKVEEYIHE